jgi:hypothetical protein
MSSVSDISEGELRVVGTTLEKRCSQGADVQPGDAEIRLDVSGRALTACPVFHRHGDGCSFVAFETGERRDRARLFCRGVQQCGA